MSPEQQASRGDAAERLLKDELLNEAFNVLEQEYTNLWKQTKPSDEAAREKLWLSLRQLEMVRAQLHSVVQTGKVAKATLAQRAKAVLQSGLMRSRF